MNTYYYKVRFKFCGTDVYALAVSEDNKFILEVNAQESMIEDMDVEEFKNHIAGHLLHQFLEQLEVVYE